MDELAWARSQEVLSTYQLAIRQTRATAIESNLVDIEIGLEDLSRMAPGREIRNGISLVGNRVPHLHTLGHLSLTNAGISIVARVETAGRRMVVPEHHDAGVERQVLFRHLLAP